MSCRYRTTKIVSRVTAKSANPITPKTSNVNFNSVISSDDTQPETLSLRSTRSILPDLDLNGFKTSLCNSKELCLGGIVNDMLNSGISQTDLTNIGSDITQAISCAIGIQDLLDILNKILDQIKGIIDSVVNAVCSLLQQLVQLFKMDSYQVFNAKKSISIPDPVTSNQGGTSQPTIPNSNYSIKDSYPKSYGSIDEIKNWTKVNTQTGQSEIVHNSQAQLKIDKSGNVVTATPGSVKTVISGDSLLEVKGNMGIVVGGNLTFVVSGNTSVKVNGTQTETVSGAVNETYGSQTTNGGTNIDLTAGTIHLN